MTTTETTETTEMTETTELRGVALAASLRAEILASIDRLLEHGGRPPTLATILVGSHPPSEAYRASIDRTLRRVGIEHRPLDLPAETTPEGFVGHLRSVNGDDTVTGVLVLMPLPPHLPSELVLEHLSPLKDVDGITPTNAGRLHMGLPSLRPSTPQGGLELLDHHGIALPGTRAVVIGRSNVVGRPLASLLMQRHATVTTCHRQTRDIEAVCREAELLAVAAGHAGLVTRDWVRPGAVVLDFGVNVTADGRLVGDADYRGLQGHAGAVTPVPGGTGPVTALVLARNTVAAGFAAMAGTLDSVALVGAH